MCLSALTDFFSLLNDRQQLNFILGEDNKTRTHLDLSQFAQCIMRILNPIWINMPDREIKVHRRVIQMIFPMIESANNDRPVENVCHGRTMQIQYIAQIQLKYADIRTSNRFTSGSRGRKK